MSKKPQIGKIEAQEILGTNKVADKVCLIGIRGYYLDGIGKRGENDRNVYDDVMILISPRLYETFRANTDPSVYRKGIATMKTGVHRYYKGKHKGYYWALRLVGEKVAVTRDGETGTKIGIALNIHKGGVRTTGSAGCQTLAPADWDDFIELVYDEMKFYNQKTIPYVLIDERDRRRGAFKMPHLPTFIEEEIKDLLSNLDKENEPAASVGTIQKPASNSAALPQTVAPDSQPQARAEAPAQPVQTILETSAESFAIPTFGGYLTEATEKVSQVQSTVGSVVETVQSVKEATQKILPIDGGSPLDSPLIQIFNTRKTKAIEWLVWIVSIPTTVFGFLTNNWVLLVVGAAMIGVIVWQYFEIQKLKARIAADPHLYNVK